KQALPTSTVVRCRQWGQWRAVGGEGGEGQWRVLEFWALFLLEIFLTRVSNWIRPVSLRIRLVISDCI
ncbi:687_t:CDS:2, partial [Funneliformis caledonium]